MTVPKSTRHQAAGHKFILWAVAVAVLIFIGGIIVKGGSETSTLPIKGARAVSTEPATPTESITPIGLSNQMSAQAEGSHLNNVYQGNAGSSAVVKADLEGLTFSESIDAGKICIGAHVVSFGPEGTDGLGGTFSMSGEGLPETITGGYQLADEGGSIKLTDRTTEPSEGVSRSMPDTQFKVSKPNEGYLMFGHWLMQACVPPST
jgi:hypothetical protein